MSMLEWLGWVLEQIPVMGKAPNPTPAEEVEFWKRFWGAEATAGPDPDNSLEAWYEGTGVWSSPIPAGADPVWQPTWVLVSGIAEPVAMIDHGPVSWPQITVSVLHDPT